MIERGTCIRVQTRTKEDVCGVCVYQIAEDGLPAPEKHRQGKMDGVKCVMLGGSGPAARPGWTIIDSADAIARNIKEGITEIISVEEARKLQNHYEKKAASAAPGKQQKGTPYGTGIEIDI